MSLFASISSIGSISSNKNETMNLLTQTNNKLNKNEVSLLGLGISKLVSGLLNTVGNTVESLGL